MGKFEKLVVLSVFLAAAVVLAVALNRGKEQLDNTNPIRGAQEVMGAETKGAGARTASRPTPGKADPAPRETPPAPESVGPDTGTSLLLNAADESAAGLRAQKPVEAPARARLGTDPVSDRDHRILGSDAGLRPSFLDEYMLYTVAAGDTWSGLAQRFYQDGRYTRNLQQANDGLVDLAPGKDILVPVYDVIQIDAGLQPDLASGTPVRSGGLEGATPDSAPAVPERSTPARSTPASAATTGEVYVVRSGDTLSDISKAVFGSATRWQELLDANTDVLKKPEALQVGMKLKIPAGGKLPTGPVATAAPAAAKKTTESKPAPKKSKVN